jgi:putative tricarboxylic transport membrane protein
MADAALAALVALADPFRLLMLFTGLLAGAVIGMLPGLGGIAAVSILLPFIYGMDPYSGLAMLLGALGVVYTADTITSVLVGTPGSPASAPTAIEGFAMAQQGEAGRALSAAFLSSMIGGLTGAVVLTLAIPVAGPLVLALGTPELLMLGIVGLSYASGLVGRDRAKGIASGALGLALGMVGVAPAAVELRYTFGQAYLLEGLSLVVVALGFFGVAEVISMLGRGGAISQHEFKIAGVGAGARDVLRNWGLAIKGALIGVVAGLIPAVGANASTWIAYGHAVSTTRDKSRVGKGEVRGIVASEGANNATVAADLVPTMLFGVPGGPAAAIFLGALFVYGFYPGPRFIQMHQDVMFLIIWSTAIAAIAGAALCFLISPFIARITRIDFGLVAAPLLVVMLLGAYEATQVYADFIVLLMFGVVGWLMKQGGWPRAPLLVGFVLSDPIERNFWLTNQLHGWTWLGRPIVIGLALLVLLPFALAAYRALRARWAGEARKAAAPASAAAGSAPSAAAEPTVTGRGFDLNLAFAAAAAILFAYALWQAFGFRADSRLGPLLAAVPGLIAAVTVLARRLTGAGARAAWPGQAEALHFLLLAAAIVGIRFIGFLPSIAVYLTVLLLLTTHLRLTALAYAAGLVALAYGLMQLLDIRLA